MRANLRNTFKLIIGTLGLLGLLDAVQAIVSQVTWSEEKLVYFLTMDCEWDLTHEVPTDVYMKLRGLLAYELYQSRTLALTLTETLPPDASVFAVLGPKAQFLPIELS